MRTLPRTDHQGSPRRPGQQASASAIPSRRLAHDLHSSRPRPWCLQASSAIRSASGGDCSTPVSVCQINPKFGSARHRTVEPSLAVIVWLSCEWTHQEPTAGFSAQAGVIGAIAITIAAAQSPANIFRRMAVIVACPAAPDLTVDSQAIARGVSRRAGRRVSAACRGVRSCAHSCATRRRHARHARRAHFTREVAVTTGSAGRWTALRPASIPKPLVRSGIRCPDRTGRSCRRCRPATRSRRRLRCSSARYAGPFWNQDGGRVRLRQAAWVRSSPLARVGPG